MRILVAALSALFLSCAVKAAERTPIAVADFTAERSTQLVRGLPDLLAERLLNSGRFDVYERTKLRTILDEQGLHASGVADPESAVSLGKIIGVPYLLTGNITSYGSETRDFSGYGVRTRTAIYRLHANMRIIDVQTGRMIFSRTETAEETVNEGQSSGARDTTMDAKLATRVADQFMRALLNSDLFVEPKAAETKMVRIRIDSEPEQADVEINGIFYGNAGTEFEVAEGLQQIDVSLPGYEPWSRRVRVQDGMSFKATLVRKVDMRIEVNTP